MGAVVIGAAAIAGTWTGLEGCDAASMGRPANKETMRCQRSPWWRTRARTWAAACQNCARFWPGEGFAEPLWYEVGKSKKAPAYARRAVAEGAELIFVWGGDGMVQRCVDAVAGTDAVLAILPAGTANLLATNLNIPDDMSERGQGWPARRAARVRHRHRERRALRRDGGHRI